MYVISYLLCFCVSYRWRTVHWLWVFWIQLPGIWYWKSFQWICRWDPHITVGAPTNNVIPRVVLRMITWVGAARLPTHLISWLCLLGEKSFFIICHQKILHKRDGHSLCEKSSLVPQGKSPGAGHIMAFVGAGVLAPCLYDMCKDSAFHP